MASHTQSTRRMQGGGTTRENTKCSSQIGKRCRCSLDMLTPSAEESGSEFCWNCLDDSLSATSYPICVHLCLCGPNLLGEYVINMNST